MIGLALLLPDKRQGVPPQAFGVLGAATLLWSPFAAIGLAPFMLVRALRIGREAVLDWGNIACAVTLGIPLIGYLSAGTGGLPHGFSWNHAGFSWPAYVEFVVLEVGLYLVALWFCGCWQHLKCPVIVVVMLLLLPLYRVGIFNDFTMRACIPPIMLVAIAAATATVEARSVRCLPLVVLILVGSITSVLEIIGRSRDGVVIAREQTLRSGVIADPPYVVQYNATLPNWVLRSPD
jgi:hypothetical protein